MTLVRIDAVAMDLSDLEAAIRQGEVSALAELFEANRERLWRMVRFRLDVRLVGRVDPDDILQEAYLDAVTRLPHFDGSMTGFLWLRWVVQQTMIGVHRRHLGTQMRSANREQPLAGPATSKSLAVQLSQTPTSPSEVMMRNERAEMLTTALSKMSELDQEVIALRHFEDLTNQEVADVLAISTKAASIRYVRALARLRKALEAIDESLLSALTPLAGPGHTSSPPASPSPPSAPPKPSDSDANTEQGDPD